MSSVDSVALRFMRPQPPPDELRAKGWQPRYDPRFGTVSKWVKHPDAGSHNPNLTWSQQEGGTAWITSEVSLPKHVYGSNTVDLRDSDLETALDSVSEYTSKQTGADCDAFNGIVGRVDYAENFRVGEKFVPAYLDAALDGRLPHFRPPFLQGESTVTFTTKSSRQVQLYSKFDETAFLAEKGKATSADVDNARGVLRLESRYRTTQACSRLAKRLEIDRNAVSLLSGETARRVIEMELDQLTFNKPVKPLCGRLEALLEHFGDAKVAYELYGFLAFRDAYGDRFYRIPKFNISKATYDRQVRKLKNAGLWLNTQNDTQLPPLAM